MKRNGITLTQDSGEKVNLWYHDVSFDVISQHNKITFLFRPEQTHGSNKAHLIQIERYKTKHFMKRAVISNAIFLLIILAKIEIGSPLQRSMLLPHGRIRPGWRAPELWSRWPLSRHPWRQMLMAAGVRYVPILCHQFRSKSRYWVLKKIYIFPKHRLLEGSP